MRKQREAKHCAAQAPKTQEQGPSTPSLPDKQEGNEGGNKGEPQLNLPRGGVRWKCPACGGQDLYINARGKTYLSLRLSACKAFKSMRPADRSRLVEKNIGCRRCTGWMHHAELLKEG